MLVSFIIPAYNAADTIVRCLDSIYELPLKREEFEVIVIDDCSTDETIHVVEDYAKFLNSLTPSFVNSLYILRQSENHRQGAARNIGVSVAQGEYICFVDSDDAVLEGIVKAIRSAEGEKTDMTVLHYAFVNESGAITQDADKLSFAEGQLFSGIEMQNTHPYWCSGPVAYVYNREFLERVNYPFVEGVLFEDSDFVVVHLYHAKRMTYSAELGYKAYYREGSTTRSMNYKNVADYLLLGVRMMRFYERIVNNSRESRIESQEIEQFAEGILDGACWNVTKACKRMIKLGNVGAVKAYYERINEYVDINDIYTDGRLRKYYWNGWTSLCVGHKIIATMLLTILMPLYRIIKGMKELISE